MWQRLAIAIATLLSANLLTLALRWLIAENLISLEDAFPVLAIVVLIGALFYYSTLGQRYDLQTWLQQPQSQLYLLASVAGILFGFR